ncbi:MAG: cobalamin biosynthesis protein P47K [Planctomyces sp.]|nr:cobalamin biosynthesis protein P47K [Planctomyces sp.]
MSCDVTAAETAPRTIRFIMVGGFLGAGKTTTLARLARHYMGEGLTVGIVTNDQATDLVDTNSLRSQGFDVGEVAGACFCCHFNELIATLGRLDTANAPDVILAEPVGSCTDLVATVVQPLKQLYAARFSIAPYGVLLKPSHGLKILRGEGSGFSPKAAYILEKQLEEADAVLINRADELSPEQMQELVTLVKAKIPGTPVLRVSAKTGDGFEVYRELLGQDGAFGRKILDIDYDIYAEGEAELGWLNASVTISGEEPISLDGFLLGVIGYLKEKLAATGAETAHLKAIGLWEGFFGVANLTSSDGPAELSLPSNCQVKQAEVVVNARVAIDPEELQTLVTASLAEVAEEMGVTVALRQTQSFRPGRPTPTHRLATPV